MKEGPLGRPRRGWTDNTKSGLRKTGLDGVCGLDSRGSLQRPVADIGEVDNETSASIKCRKFPDYITNCQLHKKNCRTICQ